MSNLGNENKLRRRLKMRKQEGFKQIILDSLDNVNKSKPKNFEIALQELNKIFSDIKGFEAFKIDTDLILIMFKNQEVAHVSGLFSLESQQYIFLNNELEILFSEEDDLAFIENSYKGSWSNRLKNIKSQSSDNGNNTSIGSHSNNNTCNNTAEGIVVFPIGY